MHRLSCASSLRQTSSAPASTRLSGTIRTALVVTTVLVLGGCALAPSPTEQAQKQAVTRVGRTLDASPRSNPPVPPGPGSPPADYLRFALLHHPQVAAAYQEWKSSVDAIAPSRALPDPQLTFQADISKSLMSLMPGFMVDITAPGKREAMAREASATSEIAYRAYVATLVQTSSDLRRAWATLAATDRSIDVRRDMIALLRRMAESSRAAYESGTGMTSLTEQSDALNGIHGAESELANLEDRRTVARARFKAALGLEASDPDPAWPAGNFADTAVPDDATLWNRILAANPDLLSMRAMIDMADAQVGVAAKAGTPDFSAGLMADLKANPLMFRPTATLSLPIWREKISAVIASARSREIAARDRLDARRIDLAVEVAQAIAMIHESDRMIFHIDGYGGPTLDRNLASAEAALQAGMGGLDSVLRLRLMTLDLRLERIEAVRQRELALADLIQMSAADLSNQPALTAEPPAPSSQP